MRYLDPRNDLTFKKVFLQESAFTLGELDANDRYWDQVRVERTLLADSPAEGGKLGREECRAAGHVAGLQEAIGRLLAGGMTEAEARNLLGLGS